MMHDNTEKCGYILNGIGYEILKFYSLANCLFERIKYTDDQLIDIKNKSIIYEGKREEYIKKSAECESVSRMHFKVFEKPFNMYSMFIKTNISFLFDSYDSIVNSIFKMSDLLKKYMINIKNASDNNLINKKELTELNYYFLIMVKEFSLCTEIMYELCITLTFIDKEYEKVSDTYKDPLIYK